MPVDGLIAAMAVAGALLARHVLLGRQSRRSVEAARLVSQHDRNAVADGIREVR